MGLPLDLPGLRRSSLVHRHSFFSGRPPHRREKESELGSERSRLGRGQPQVGVGRPASPVGPYSARAFSRSAWSDPGILCGAQVPVGVRQRRPGTLLGKRDMPRRSHGSTRRRDGRTLRCTPRTRARRTPRPLSRRGFHGPSASRRAGTPRCSRDTGGRTRRGPRPLSGSPRRSARTLRRTRDRGPFRGQFRGFA